MRYFDCIIIGAGAAGLMCAASAGRRGRTVALLDHANKVGKKILMSGGGRCNFTNYYVEPDNYVSSNPHFCKSALSRYSPYDFLELVHKYDVQYHEKTRGQLFCDDKAKEILNLLLQECNEAAVEIHTRCEVHSVQRRDSSIRARYHLHTTAGEFQCHSLVIATGGLSIPTMGATGFGYDIARQFGLRVTPVQAALVPFTLTGHWLTLARSLAGVSLPVRVTCRQQAFQEALLFTHKGLSGPAILQISSYWNPGDDIRIDLLPGTSIATLLQERKAQKVKATARSLLAQTLPRRFVNTWFETCCPELMDVPAVQLEPGAINAIATVFHDWRCIPAGTEGYRTAEVTRGGVDTDEISSKTFESRKVPGLFFIGEVLDVTGWLGGFNFQWAWASGHCAAQFV